MKYASLFATGFVAMPLASGIEARLIQAEAAYHGVATGAGTWIDQLNHLRETATVPGQTAALADTTDPGDSPGDTARVNLLFSERAYWLYLEGHRQGDLRRLLRQYGRRQDEIYPTGSYLAPGLGFYGSDVNMPIPGPEYANPLFHGCLDRRA